MSPKSACVNSHILVTTFFDMIQKQPLEVLYIHWNTPVLDSLFNNTNLLKRDSSRGIFL